jgi:cobalt-zinc-cadmium efflux system outer membrane protein
VPPLLTLDDAVALALEFNPALAGSSWRVGVAQGREIQAGKIPNPEIDFRFAQLGERRGEEDVSRRRIFLREEFELGGKRRRRVDLAQIESQLADWSYRDKRSEIATAVAMEFAAVLGAQRSVELYGELVEYIEKLHAAAEQMVEMSSLGRMEMQLIVRRRGLARIDLGSAEAQLAAARFGLAAIWGSSPPDFDTAVGDLEPAGPIPSIDAVLEMAKGSPSTERWEAEVERSRAELSLSRSGAVPDLEVGLGYAWEDNSSPPDYILDFQIDLPLFNRNQGSIQAANSELQRTEARREAAEAVDARLIAQMYYELSERAARSSILGEEVIPAVRAAVATSRLAFEGQAQGLADVLDSRRDLAKAEMRRTEALVDYRQTLAELEHLIGQPLVPE